jgi:hypothetical protein
MDNLSSKTVKQLVEYAEENGIDLKDAKTKTKILSIIMDINSNISVAEDYKESTVITGPEQTKTPRISNTKSNDDGVITVHSADKRYPPIKSEKKTPEITNEKVAVHSSKNLSWQGVGKLSPGYNILTKEIAEKWLTNKYVREAAPEEVATYYGRS